MRKTFIGHFLTLTISIFLLISPHKSHAQVSDKDAFKQCVVPNYLNNDNSLCHFETKEVKGNQEVTFFASMANIYPSPTPTPKKVESKISPTPKKEFSRLSFLPDYTSTLSAEILFNLVNEYRVNSGLTAYERNDSLCEIAYSRSGELYNEIFNTGRLHKGFYDRNLPYWATENVIYAGSEEAAFNWWRNSYVHRSSMLGDYKYSCCACNGRACSQIFTSFTPKQNLAYN